MVAFGKEINHVSPHMSLDGNNGFFTGRWDHKLSQAIIKSDEYPIRCNMGIEFNFLIWKSELFNLV